MKASDYGDRYWCVKTPLSDDGEIYLFADRVEVLTNGALAFYRDKPIDRPNLIIPPGGWTAVFAASTLDGHAVAVEYWAGEINETK